MPDLPPLTRREALGLTGAASAGFIPGVRRLLHAVDDGHGPIARIEPEGMLIRDCRLTGETRDNDVFPAHPNGIPVSRNRWLLVYATRGYDGVDDDRSIVYQLREGAPDGRLIREGALARSRNDWDPLGDGNTRHVLQHGHPVAFGVPRGALVGGKPAANANVFVVKWRRVGRDYDPVKKLLVHSDPFSELEKRTQAVEWVQFRLNRAEDDIEIIQPATRLRQKGYETGERFCAGPVRTINESFVQAVPFNRERTEWADCCHFDGGRLACLKYVFNPALGRYEWTERGPFFALPAGSPVVPATGGQSGVVEASLARWRDSWIVAARGGPGGGSSWWRTEDPFAGTGAPAVNPDSPRIAAPLTAYTWEDGNLRVFAGDAGVSPRRNSRDPLYCWDVDPDRGFLASRRRVIFDTVAAGLPLPSASGPKVDMCKLLAGQGRTQVIVYRVSIRAYNHPYAGAHGVGLATPEAKAACGIYYSRLTYREDFPAMWDFARERSE